MCFCLCFGVCICMAIMYKCTVQRWSFARHYLSPSSGVREKFSNSNGRTRSLPYFTRKATKWSAETTTASRLCHTRVRCSLKWLPGDLASTVRQRDCYRRIGSGFDQIARPRTHDACVAQAVENWAEGRSVSLVLH